MVVLYQTMDLCLLSYYIVQLNANQLLLEEFPPLLPPQHLPPQSFLSNICQSWTRRTSGVLTIKINVTRCVLMAFKRWYF